MTLTELKNSYEDKREEIEQRAVKSRVRNYAHKIPQKTSFRNFYLLTRQFPMDQIGAFWPLRRDCARLSDRRMT